MSQPHNTFCQVPSLFIINLTYFPHATYAQHATTVSMLRMRGTGGISGSLTMIQFENSIRAHVERTCAMIEQYIPQAPSRALIVQGVSAMMQISKLLVDGETRMCDDSLEVKIRAMEVLFSWGLMWVVGPSGRGSIVPI